MNDCCVNCAYYDKESKHCVKTGFRWHPYDRCDQYAKDVRPCDRQVDVGRKMKEILDSLNKK